MAEVAAGDGPIDAAFWATEKITGVKLVCKDFQVRSATIGHDAQGEATLEVEHDGELFRGRGVSTDTGEASIEHFTGHSGEMVVRGFPELPGGMRKVISGHVARILELTGAKEVQIVLVEDDPDAWRWKISWNRT